MEEFKTIKQGAEARILCGTYLGKPTLIKERFVKHYRQPDLDIYLTKERIRAECRAINKSKSVGIRTPTLYYIDMEKRMIYMEYFENNITVKDFIFQHNDNIGDQLCYDIGVTIAKLHSSNIIHGDLTTSNMLLHNKNKLSKFDNYTDLEFILIDFGLAHCESSAEDKGVDLYVLERAILSTHSSTEDLFPKILKAYKSKYGNKEVLSKFEEVRARGRKRTMVG